MFVVTKFFGRSEVREKNFSSLPDAKKFIQEKLLKDIELRIKATYRIYEGADLLEEITQKDAVLPSSASDSGSSSKGSRQVFSPTPLSTSPRPKGIPQNWKEVNDEDDNKEK